MKIKKWEELNGVKNDKFMLIADINSFELWEANGETYINHFCVKLYSKQQILGILKVMGFDIEFEEQQKLTEQEWHLVRGLPNGWIVRNRGGQDTIYVDMLPYKDERGGIGQWLIKAQRGRSSKCYLLPRGMFSFIEWEDEEPWTSKELLKLEKI